jgi:hypothetical protein
LGRNVQYGVGMAGSLSKSGSLKSCLDFLHVTVQFPRIIIRENLAFFSNAFFAPFFHIATRKSNDLTTDLRGQIVGRSHAGQSNLQIQRGLKIPESTIQDTLNHFPERINNQSKKETGRYRIGTALDVRNILQLVQATPKIKYKQIRKQLDITFSNDTLKRILERKGIKNWRCKRRPLLTPNVVHKRYQWAKAHINWTLEQRMNYIFSNEYLIERGSEG